MIQFRDFFAFNTDISICAVGTDNKIECVLDKIQKYSVDFERRFSRFNYDSELSALNRVTNFPYRITTEMKDLLIRSLAYYKSTDGLFDPTVLPILVACGYDKSFEMIPSGNITCVSTELKKRASFDCMEIVSDEVLFRQGLQIDLGGIAKGYWVDKASEMLRTVCENFWISAGGDIFLQGVDECSDVWTVGVENPLLPSDDLLVLSVPVHGCGVATSSVVKRHGRNNETEWHHMIDPRTNAPVENDILSVTVIAADTTTADVLAKTVLILGVEDGLNYIDSLDNVECVIVDRFLSQYVSKYLTAYL